MATRRTHTREEALAAIQGVIDELQRRADADRANGVTDSRYADGVEYAKESRVYLRGLRPPRDYRVSWGRFDRYVSEDMPWDEEILKIIHDAKRVVRIYLRGDQ